MRKIGMILTAIIFSLSTQAQEAYKFKTVIDLEATPVISQGRTGTCWSFSTSSFIESEIIRLTGKQIDLSEMYTVRNTYTKKAENYIVRQGKCQFSEGGLAHDVLNSIKANFVLVWAKKRRNWHSYCSVIGSVNRSQVIIVHSPSTTSFMYTTCVSSNARSTYLPANVGLLI